MTDASEWDELEPQRERTAADRWRLATWMLIFASIFGLLMVAPIGDGVLVEAAQRSGTDEGPARLVYWITLLVGALIGNGIGAAAAATKQRWAIVPPLLAAAGYWIGFFIAQGLVAA